MFLGGEHPSPTAEPTAPPKPPDEVGPAAGVTVSGGSGGRATRNGESVVAPRVGSCGMFLGGDPGPHCGADGAPQTPRRGWARLWVWRCRGVRGAERRGMASQGGRPPGWVLRDVLGGRAPEPHCGADCAPQTPRRGWARLWVWRCRGVRGAERRGMASQGGRPPGWVLRDVFGGRAPEPHCGADCAPQTPRRGWAGLRSRLRPPNPPTRLARLWVWRCRGVRGAERRGMASQGGRPPVWVSRDVFGGRAPEPHCGADCAPQTPRRDWAARCGGGPTGWCAPKPARRRFWGAPGPTRSRLRPPNPPTRLGPTVGVAVSGGSGGRATRNGESGWSPPEARSFAPPPSAWGILPRRPQAGKPALGELRSRGSCRQYKKSALYFSWRLPLRRQRDHAARRPECPENQHRSGCLPGDGGS